MTYSKRIAIALVMSLLAHAALLLLLRPALGSVERREPESRQLVVQLQETPRQYIETQVPADEAPEEAEHISTQDAHAMSVRPDEEVDADTPGPSDLPVDDGDIAPREPAIVEVDNAVAALPPSDPIPSETPPAREKTDSVSDDAPERAERFEIARAESVPLPEPTPVPLPAPVPRDKPEPATEELPREDGLPQEGRTRSRGRTVTHGATNFEALRHEIAPYLDQIKKAVERRWLEMLLMRYSGASPTRAEIYCAIAPDGSLAEARIVGMPEDYLFAGLCRDAVQRAAPFPPFPFEVPDIYRDQNLQITWHFRFL